MRSRSGGDGDRENVEAVVEVCAEFAGFHHLGEVAIGGGDQAGVGADGARTAEAFEFALLQNAQEFGLQLDRNFADFVEEDRAAMGQFEAADALRDGAGEGAFFVAEQLTFEQVRWGWRRSSV